MAPTQPFLKGLQSLMMFGFWLTLIRTLWPEWSLNPNYQYGLAVPWICLYLAKIRLKIALNQNSDPALPGSSNPYFWIPMATLTIPILVILRANPEWRLAIWIHALLILALTLCWIAQLGGRKWVCHFLPICLIALSAIPWPSTLESHVIQWLMSKTASVSVLGLNWFGLPAWQKGNLIEVATGVVGVDEACSGIRSLQTTIMISLFWGEIYLLTRFLRVFFVVLSLILTLSLNLTRATSMAYIAAKWSPEEISRFHDPAGWMIAVASFVILGLLARFFRNRSTAVIHSTTAVHPHSGWMSFKAGPVVAGLAILLGGEAIRWGWFLNPSDSGSRRSWIKLQSDVGTGPRLTAVPIPRATTALLRADSASCLAWTNWNGTEGRLFLFNWDKGSTSQTLASIHQPETCLPAVGMELTERAGPFELKLSEVRTSTKGLKFRSSRGEIFVFHARWRGTSVEQKTPVPVEMESWRQRLSDAWNRRLSEKQQVLEIALSGAQTTEAALAVAQEVCNNLVRMIPES